MERRHARHRPRLRRTFRLCASPEHAWDFAWFYAFIGEGGLRNWDRIVAGELPPDSLGVTAVDALTLQIVTEGPFPAMPSVMKFGYTLQKRALEEHGPYYNSDLATSVSSGPFVLAEFDPGNRIVLEANPDYTGYRPPRLARIEGIYMSPATYFLAFQSGEIDIVGHEQLTSADFAIIRADSTLMANYLRHYGDFRTDYILFDTFTPPFDNLDVRRAFAHAVNRQAIVAGVYGSIKAQPAHSMLMPGFPSADTAGELADLQRFDCGLARQHLAAAGYPDGEDFPPLVMWLRGEPPATAAVYQASAASIASAWEFTSRCRTRMVRSSWSPSTPDPRDCSWVPCRTAWTSLTRPICSAPGGRVAGTRGTTRPSIVW